MKECLLVGGPANGKTYTVSTIRETIVVTTAERADVAMTSVTPSVNVEMKTSTYRVRRIATTYHPVHNSLQQVLYDYVGGA